MANLLVIPQHFDLEIYTTSRQEKALESLLKLVQEAVDKHTDTDVLETAAQTLEKLCDDQFPIYSRCDTNRSRLLDMVCNKYKESLDEYTNLLSGDEEPDQDEIFALISSLKKVSIFYNCHDMGQMRIWPGLLDIVSKSKDMLLERQPLNIPEEAVKYALLGCYFGLLWEKNNLVQNLGGSTTDGDVSEVQAKLLNFIEQCKKLLAVPANVVQLKEEAFLSVCDLLIVFGHCGKAPGQAALEPLALHPDRGMGELLKRRNFLSSYCKLSIYNVLPTKTAADVLKHYVTFYNDYGDIIKYTLNKTRENNKTNCAKTMV